MKRALFLPMAALVLAAACTDNSSTPTETLKPAFGSGGFTANPAYKSSSYTIASDVGLNHSWRQTGLGSFTDVPYTLDAVAEITAHCENPGHNTVAGAPFQISEPLSSDQKTFPQRNGAINGSITLSPSAVACQPPGGNPHDAIIDAVVYSSIKFCWGKDISAADLQGPIPGGPGSGAKVPPNASGIPLSGSQSGSTAAELGIFASCVST
jgi:hypothetical protein